MYLFGQPVYYYSYQDFKTIVQRMNKHNSVKCGANSIYQKINNKWIEIGIHNYWQHLENDLESVFNEKYFLPEKFYHAVVQEIKLLKF